MTTTDTAPELPARVRPHAFRVVWTYPGQPGRLTTPLTLLGAELPRADAVTILAGVAGVDPDLVIVEDVVALGPVRALHPDAEEEPAEDPLARACPDCRSTPGRPCRDWWSGAARVPHPARLA